MPPHIFQIAADAYMHLQTGQRDQAIISSGESGAGKTENTKQVFFFLAQVAAPSDQEDSFIQQQLMDSNFVL